MKLSCAATQTQTDGHLLDQEIVQDTDSRSCVLLFDLTEVSRFSHSTTRIKLTHISSLEQERSAQLVTLVIITLTHTTKRFRATFLFRPNRRRKYEGRQ